MSTKGSNGNGFSKEQIVNSSLLRRGKGYIERYFAGWQELYARRSKAIYGIVQK